jgi:hypothetical protein
LHDHIREQQLRRDTALASANAQPAARLSRNVAVRS